MRLDGHGYYALGIPAYLALMGLEEWLRRRRGQAGYPFAETVGNLSAGLGAVVVGLFLAPFFFAAYDLGLDLLAVVRWPEGSWVPWVLGVVVADFCYYWQHRVAHRVGALFAIHGVHHQSSQFDLSVAMRHPWFSDFVATPFYALAPLLGITSEAFFFGASVISFYAFTVHTDLFARPGLGVLVTPATHVVHHATNRRYLNKNFGAMFTVWDRLFGTHVEVDPDDPPVLGIRAGYPGHDGVRAQWALALDVLHVVRRAPRLSDRLAALVRHPGWRPAGVPPRARRPVRAEASIGEATRRYVLFQFGLTLTLACYVLWFRDAHPFALSLVSVAAIVWSLRSLGQILDGHPRAHAHEVARLAALAVAALLVGLAIGPTWLAWAGVAGAALSLAWTRLAPTVFAASPAPRPP